MKKVIDISAWQENVDWEQLKEEVDGVILKLGEYEHMDDMFVSHVNNAVAVGLPYGVYYYAHAAYKGEAVEEAEWVKHQINLWLAGKTPELGIWYDAEDDSMTEDYNVTSVVKAFISTLKSAGHTYVGVYSSWNWLSEQGESCIDVDYLLGNNIPVWVASYGKDNDFDGYHRNYLKEEYPNMNIKLHQFTDIGSVANISPVDCNIYYE